jgi:hypothetical protein
MGPAFARNQGKLKHVGGSQSDDWNNRIVNDAWQALWLKHSECYRRAMLGEQTFEGRRENLSQANKLSRTYATLLEALNRHRGKGQQKVTVEHVHVHEGGQAIVESEDQPHAKQIAHASQPAVWSADRERKRVPITSNAERAMPASRRTAEAIEERKSLRSLVSAFSQKGTGS